MTIITWKITGHLNAVLSYLKPTKVPTYDQDLGVTKNIKTAVTHSTWHDENFHLRTGTQQIINWII